MSPSGGHILPPLGFCSAGSFNLSQLAAPAEVAALPVAPAVSMGTLTYEQIYAGGMSTLTLAASTGGLPGVQLPIIPEPASVGLLSLALVLLGASCRPLRLPRLT
jgi:hypothetical protein